MWIEENFFKYSVGIILILLIILLLYYTLPFFYPLVWFVTAIMLPVLFSTLLYHLLRPLVNLLSRWMPRYLAIMIIYFCASGLIAMGIFVIAPDVMKVISTISPEKIEAANAQVVQFFNRLKDYLPLSFATGFDNMFSSISYVDTLHSIIYKLSVNLLSTLTSIAVSIVLTPFVLYYFLRDDGLFTKFVMRYVPTNFQEEVQKILVDVDTTLSDFVLSQATLAAIIGVVVFCGYWLIGLPYPLPLALFAMIFYLIPFLGTFIAIIPALLLGLTISLDMTIKVVAVMYVAHFLEANILTPRIMSHHLKIHPLTIILLLLAAGSIYGILGLLLVIPTYAILKVIVWNLYKISRLHYTIAKMKAETAAEEDIPK